jgi:hypothetical protein
VRPPPIPDCARRYLDAVQGVGAGAPVPGPRGLRWTPADDLVLAHLAAAGLTDSSASLLGRPWPAIRARWGRLYPRWMRAAVPLPALLAELRRRLVLWGGIA